MTETKSPVSTEYGFKAYLPLPKDEREGTALCMSGGGYRAALFHLGALRRLDELGVLSKVDTFTSVSGGSIILAQVASHRAALGEGWPAPGERVPRFDEGIAEPMRAFAKTDIRTRSALTGLNPTNWLDQNAGIDALAKHYAKAPARGKLADLAPHPRFVFCATDLRFRTQWVFDTGLRRRGSDQAGYGPLTDDWTVARAVAASSCVPGAFRPMKVENDPKELVGGAYEGPDRDDLVKEIELADGGFYDNLGVEPVWRDHADVLVSDAAPSFTIVPRLGAAWRALRYIVTLLEQSTDVRKRWLISSFLLGELRGTYWGMGSMPTAYPEPGPDDPHVGPYPDEVIRDYISQVRIDLDEFSDGEIGVLENHGYLMAEIAVRRHAKHLIEPRSPDPVEPWPAWTGAAAAREALAESDKTKLFPSLRLAFLKA